MHEWRLGENFGCAVLVRGAGQCCEMATLIVALIDRLFVLLTVFYGLVFMILWTTDWIYET